MKMAKVAHVPKPKARRRVPHPALPPGAPDIEYLKNLQLPEGDGEPLESDWHVVQIWLLNELVGRLFGERTDFFCGGNMFIYYSLNQAQSVLQGNPQYKGPDFFLVKDVDGTKPRRSWIVWEEDGKYPSLIVELLSPSTAQKDREEKKQLYAKVFHTPEYFWYDAFSGELAGFCLHEEEYIPIEPNERGWLWSHQLGAYFGVWEGVYHRREVPLAASLHSRGRADTDRGGTAPSGTAARRGGASTGRTTCPAAARVGHRPRCPLMKRCLLTRL
jgi:Uma2 family endonuclease